MPSADRFLMYDKSGHERGKGYELGFYDLPWDDEDDL
jgi:hypothetical protein